MNSKTLERNSLLDILRFIAAMLVIGRHWLYQQWNLKSLLSSESYGNSASDLLIHRILKLISGWIDPINLVGFLGVNIFFMISGNIILRSVLKKTNPIHFLINRFARLFPLFLFVLLLSIPAGRFIFNSSEYRNVFNIFSSFTLANYPLNLAAPNGQTWTLWWEIRFYFLILITLLFHNKVTNLRKFYLVIVLFWLALICLPGTNTGAPSDILLKYYAPFFIFGCLTGLIRSINDLLGLSPFLALTFTLMVSNLPGQIYSQIGIRGHYTVGIALIFLASTLILCDSLGVKIPKKLRKFSSVGGLATYPIYLLHMVVGAAIIKWINDFGAGILTAILICFVFMVSVSVIYVLTIEQRIQTFIISKGKKYLQAVAQF